MKKILLAVFAVFLFSANVLADSGDHSFTAFSMNYNYLDVKTDLNDFVGFAAQDDFKLHGFSVGFIVHQKLVSYLYLTTGVSYQFGMKATNQGDFNYDIFNHTIKVPLKLAFSLAFGKNSGFSIHAGPSLDFVVSTQSFEYYNRTNYLYHDGVSGRYHGKQDDVSYSGSEPKTFGWFDIPLGVGATLNFGKLGFRFDYEWGMVNRALTSGCKWKADQLTAGIFFIF